MYSLYNPIIRSIIIMFVFMFGGLSQMIMLCTAAPPRKDWSNLDLDKLEEEWKVGDEYEELITSDELLYQESERKRMIAIEKLEQIMYSDNHKNNGRIPETDEFESLAQEVQVAGKPAMIFSKLTMDEVPNIPKLMKKKKKTTTTTKEESKQFIWDWDSIAALCQEWEVSSNIL